MGSAHSLADDFALAAEAIAELVRVSDDGRRMAAWGTDLGPAAAAAGLTGAQARGWLAGTVALPPRQSVALAVAVLAGERRARDAAARPHDPQARVGLTASEAFRG